MRKIQLMILIAFIVFYNKLVKAIIGENKMNKLIELKNLTKNFVGFRE